MVSLVYNYNYIGSFVDKIKLFCIIILHLYNIKYHSEH